jgi:hypothetical protein
MANYMCFPAMVTQAKSKGLLTFQRRFRTDPFTQKATHLPSATLVVENFDLLRPTYLQYLKYDFLADNYWLVVFRHPSEKSWSESQLG